MSGNALIRDLRDTRVLVVHPQDREGTELIRQIQRIGCRVRSVWPPSPEVPDDVDVLFFLIDRAQPAYMPWRPGERPLALIAIVDYENPTMLKALIDSNAHGVVSKPIRPFGILTSLVLARSIQGYEKRLLTKIGKLEETLRTRRDVEKATRVLMTMRNISEDEAYQMIRRQATAKRVPLATVAVSLIRAGEVMNEFGADET